MQKFPSLDRIAAVKVTAATFILTVIGLGVAGLAGSQAAPGPVDPPAQASARQVVMLGAGGPMPDARCPTRCFGLAVMTGMQTKMNGMTNPYRVPFNGEITAWKLGLGKPDSFQRKFFQDRFGTRPQAGLAVLKKVRVNGQVRYLLRKRSPLQGLNRVLGTVASFKLRRPIRVARGNIVALTVPTWAPALAMPKGLTEQSDSWRSSRSRKTCGQTISKKNSRPQQKIGSKREYGCRFNGERLLYRVKVRSR